MPVMVLWIPHGQHPWVEEKTNKLLQYIIPFIDTSRSPDMSADAEIGQLQLHENSCLKISLKT